MAVKNAFYAQSGGVTAVINATACGLIQEARRYPDRIGKVFAGRDGIIGALTEDLIDTSLESDADIARLRHTPGGAFGSCRYKLKSLEQHKAQYERLIEVFKAHDIGYFFYNGGNDSADTAWKVSQLAQAFDYPLTCIGVPNWPWWARESVMAWMQLATWMSWAGMAPSAKSSGATTSTILTT